MLKRVDIPEEDREILRRAIHEQIGKSSLSEGLVEIACRMAVDSGLERTLAIIHRIAAELPPKGEDDEVEPFPGSDVMM